MSMDMMDSSDSSLREHCRQMPNMMGCEKWKNENGMNMGHSMMDHASMVTSEEAFIVNMIPHHQEAVDTARLVLAKGESPELKKLAQAIIAAQEKEISMMQQWLRDWGYTKISPTYQNMM